MINERTYYRAVLILSIMIVPALGRVETFVVSNPHDIEDAALRNREFSDWSFGGGIVLEVGFMPGLYEEHRCVSLVRFDLSRLPCAKVHSARLRLYKPNCSVQMAPVKVAVYEVAPANADWAEGTALCEKTDEACSWRRLRKGKPWAGAEGCARPGIDFLFPALDVQTAPENRCQWMEFMIPAALVQRWLERPEANAGLYTKSCETEEKWGDHVFFFSSEHTSGKGPQLIVEGTPGEPRAAEIGKPRLKRKHLFPPDEAAFDRWLAEADNRYVRWTQAAKMTREQAMMFYYYDVIVRGKMLLPKCRVPLTEYILQLDDLIPKGDEDAVRAILKKARKRLLYWEYIREAHWYDSGPLADVLSPWQLGVLWGECIFGKMEEKHRNKSWAILTPEELERKVRETVESINERLELDAEQAKLVDPLVAKYERLEHEYVEKFMKDLKETQRLVNAGADSEEMLKRVKSLHMNHDLFLYYQSTFNTPRWPLFMEHAPAIPLARMFQEARRKEYNPERTGRQIGHAARFGSAAGDGKSGGERP